MKLIIGIGLCITGTVVWAGALIGAPVIIYPTVLSLGVIIGGGIAASGIILICLPAQPIRFSYFDKR